nr:TetR/AcrR family transcriptional regulator [Solimonas sp. K1W22B-7]
MSPAQKRIHQAALRLFAEKGTSEVTVGELAQAAGVARGTIYNNLESPDRLFEHVAAQLADEMDERIVASYAAAGIDDPALRLATGIRLYVRRAHDEPHWGRFLVHFAMTNESMRKVWMGPPMDDLVLGLQQKRYDFRPDQAATALGLLAGSTLAAIMLVLEGLRTWRDAGSDTVEMVLRGLGVGAEDARKLSVAELPPLAEIA